MSNSGKTGSIRKENFSNQKIGAVGFQGIEFYHKASAGDTIIDLSALVTPTTELAGSGFSQPSPADLLAAGIKAKQSNFKLSNSQGQELMPRIAYTIVDNSTIRLADVALEGEIFHGVIDNVTKNLAQLPETQTIVATGTLAEDATTFAVGASFRTEVNPLEQLGEVLVYRNGILLFRNVSNAAADPGADGNYEEVPIGNGFSNEIEFNIAGDVGGEVIHIVSPTRMIKDDGTLLQQVQTLQGVVDIMRDDLANEFYEGDGSRYNGFASDVDLRAFNNRVLTLEKVLDIDVPNVWAEQTLNITLNNFGNATVTEAKYSRVGDKMFGRGRIIIGSTLPTSSISFTLTDFTMVDVVENKIGTAAAIDNGVVHVGLAFQSGNDTIQFYGDDGAGAWNASVPFTWVATQDAVDFSFEVPIVGWTATQKVSDLI